MFYKLMDNAVYGKTMENLRNSIDLRVVSVLSQFVIIIAFYNKIVAFCNKTVAFCNKKSEAFCDKFQSHFVIKWLSSFVIISVAFGNNELS